MLSSSMSLRTSERKITRNRSGIWCTRWCLSMTRRCLEGSHTLLKLLHNYSLSCTHADCVDYFLYFRIREIQCIDDDRSTRSLHPSRSRHDTRWLSLVIIDSHIRSFECICTWSREADSERMTRSITSTIALEVYWFRKCQCISKRSVRIDLITSRIESYRSGIDSGDLRDWIWIHIHRATTRRYGSCVCDILDLHDITPSCLRNRGCVLTLSVMRYRYSGTSRDTGIGVGLHIISAHWCIFHRTDIRNRLRSWECRWDYIDLHTLLSDKKSWWNLIKIFESKEYKNSHKQCQ